MNRRGFTVIELMIVVAIVGVLAAIAIPQFADMTRKAQEACTKGNLGSLRSSLSIYYGDNEGVYPHDMDSLTYSNKYLSGIPQAYYPTFHSPGRDIGSGDDAGFRASFTDTAHWWYFNDEDPRWGQVVANCIHTDAKGAIWTTY